MSKEPSELPKPGRRLWRTLLRRPRKLRHLAPPIPAARAMAELPDPAEVAHWGEVILLEDLLVVLHRDGTTSWYTHVVTMPYGDQHLAEWDDVSQVFDRRKSWPTIRHAVVYTPDGERHKAGKVLVPLDTNRRGLQLTFAPLRPGVVVQFEAQQDQFQPAEVGPVLSAEFLMRAACPCRHRRLALAVARPFEATIVPHHDPPEAVRSRVGRYYVYRWEMHDVEGIEADAWTPPLRDFAPWVDISTLPDWKPVIEHYGKELLPKRPAPPAVDQLARELARDASTAEEKLKAVYSYAARDVRYGRHPSEQQIHNIRDPAKMLEDLRGDCKDKSSLMVSLLDGMDVRADVAIMLTAQNGRSPLLPSMRFDHAVVLAEVNGHPTWLDPAAGPFTFGSMPQNNQAVKALVLRGDESVFVDVPLDEPQRQLVERVYRGELNAAGDFTFRAEVTARGERAAMYRMMLIDRNDDHRRRTIGQSVAEERPGAEVNDVELNRLEDLNADVGYSYRVKLPRWTRTIGDLMLFRVPWAEPLDYIGPISAAERRLPLQMPPVVRLHDHHRIETPAGFVGYGLPYHFKHECDWAAFTCDIAWSEGRLTCRRTMDIRGGIVPVEAFADFKQFWEDCVRADRTDVVLTRAGRATG